MRAYPPGTIEQKAELRHYSVINYTQVTKYLPISYGLKEAAMLFNPREKGQGLVEYALILVLVSVVVIAILTLLGPAIGNVFSAIKNNFG
jgi:pilus assembly protein Flp/PilA